MNSMLNNKQKSIAWAVVGMIVGAAATVGTGFTKGGWVTHRGLRKALDAQDAGLNDKISVATAAALLPYCIEKSLADPNRYHVVLDLRAAKVEDRESVIEQSGWATPLGSDKPDRELGKVCLVKLNLF
ncbi:hypothetical protein Rleg10DRAFT_2582 [Rhizobium leguminosarum bv. trifolii WSM2012]|nr:hypothetical protein Rleg10DRAFT_2582 [Rhizobium leguminosarum bv. trifolii WSM2012]